MSSAFMFFEMYRKKSKFGLTVKSLLDTGWNANYGYFHGVVEAFDEILECLESTESSESKEFDKGVGAQINNVTN